MSRSGQFSESNLTGQEWTAEELHHAFDTYTQSWPDHNDKYQFWKPARLLQSPKPLIKESLKRAYEVWPEPIKWTVYFAFFMEFMDLGNYLPEPYFDIVHRLSKSGLQQFGEVKHHSPLLMCRPKLDIFEPRDMQLKAIERVRRDIHRSRAWDPLDVTNEELDIARRTLAMSHADVAALHAEWLFYIHAIGRERYVDDK